MTHQIKMILIRMKRGSKHNSQVVPQALRPEQNVSLNEKIINGAAKPGSTCKDERWALE
uniref:Uncharacterized protein n=1 Tax=Rhizophora mucronata TaxID=61149 RepID=A0A2P2NM41_RHIMU